MQKKVALVGVAPDSRGATPWDDESWDIFVLNKCSMDHGVKRANAWFEIHQEPFVYGPYREYLKQVTCPIYVQDPSWFPDLQFPTRYPIEEIIERAGCRYLTNTPAMMLALAIHLGYEEIGLYGLAMETNSEYAYERPCMEFWLGYARAHGVKVHIERPSSLLRADRIYGWEEAVETFNNNASPDELVIMLGQCMIEMAAWKTFYDRVEADPATAGDSPAFLGPQDIVALIGTHTVTTKIIQRNLAILQQTKAAVAQGVVVASRPDIDVTPPSDGVPADPVALVEAATAA